MKKSILRWISGKENPQELRREIQEVKGREMNLRRAAICSSLLGMASMAAVTLYQTGVLRRLADPPLGNFASEKVNSSDTAWGFGTPDGTLTMLAHALNVALAAAGGENRAQIRPLIPILAAGAAGTQAVVAGKYLFYQMPYVEKAWCPYCIIDATSHLLTFGFVIPEAGKALRNLFDHGTSNTSES